MFQKIILQKCLSFVNLKFTAFYWPNFELLFFDCCKQSLIQLNHPPIHPPSQDHTFLHKKGVTGNLLYRFAPILCKLQYRWGPFFSNFSMQMLKIFNFNFTTQMLKSATSNFTILLWLFSTFWNNQILIYVKWNAKTRTSDNQTMLKSEQMLVRTDHRSDFGCSVLFFVLFETSLA